MPDDPNDPTTTTSTDAASEPAAGSIIAERYRLIAHLGAGGMGAVYRGEHITLRKPVAVKFLHRFASADSEMVARFEREAQTAALIDHPHIAKAIDFGKLPDGTLYLVMEFVEGPTLAAVLRETPKLPPARALAIATAIGSALGRAHALGIVHRDIKPDNVVLCSRDGDSDFVKVIDFGIARMASSNVALTQIGTVFGTPGYLAPEQALGQTVDAAADQYALGVVTFQMLAGRMPFVADDAISLLQQHIMAPIPRASEFAPELPRGVDDVLTRMLAKRPAERFPSVDAAVNALRSAIGSAPAPASIAVASTADTIANRPAPVPSGPAWTAASNSTPNALPPDTLATGQNRVAPPTPARPGPRSRLVPIAILAVAILSGALFLALRSRPSSNVPAPVAPSASRHEPTTAPPTHAVPSNATATVAADASTAPVEPHTVGTSSRNCRDGHCVCRNALECSYSCGEEPCDAVCERMRNCRGQCGDHCRQQCRDGQLCDLHCGDDCNVACRDLHDCRVSCGERCDVDCSMMMNCQVRMRSGDVVCGERTGRCDVQCLMPDGQWQFATHCSGGRHHCPPGPC